MNERFRRAFLRCFYLKLFAVVLACAGSASAQASTSDLVAISNALRAKDFDQALRLSSTPELTAAGDPRIFSLKALALSGLFRWDDAVAAYGQALAIQPDYVPALKGSAEVEYNQHKPGAQATLEHLTRLQPGDQLAQGMLGELRLQAGDCAGADVHLSLAPAVVARQPTVLQAYSKCLIETGKYDRAADIFAQLLALTPSDDLLRYNLALSYEKSDRLDAAVQTLAPLEEQTSPPEDVLTLRAVIAERQGATQMALDLLRKAILLHPHETSAYLDYVSVAYRHGAIAIGLKIVDIGLKENPASAELYLARGVLLCGTGRVAECLPDLDKANQLDPHLALLNVASGIAHSQAQQSELALTSFRMQLKDHPDDALSAYLLAEGLFALGKPAGTPEFQEELDAASRATKLDPQRVEAQDLLASIYLEGKNYPAAIQASEAALRVNPIDQQALFHLILALRRSNQPQRLPELAKRLAEARSKAENVEKGTPTQTLTELPDQHFEKGSNPK